MYLFGHPRETYKANINFPKILNEIVGSENFSLT